MSFIKHWFSILGIMLLVGGVLGILAGGAFLISTLIDRGHLVLGIGLIILLLSLVFALISYGDRNQSDAQFV